MGVLDMLGAAGYGLMDAGNAAQGLYRNIDQTTLSGLNVARQEDQYAADSDYDIFNATAGANRAKLDAAASLSQLGNVQTQDKLDYFSPETRQDVSDMVDEHGGADTPEFRRAYANYLAGKGMLETADPQYLRAQREAAAEQQVTAMLRQIPGYAGVHSIQRGEDGNLYGLRGTADAGGNYEAVNLPPGILRQHASLSGNPAPLAYDQAMQQADLANRKSAVGKGAGSGKGGAAQSAKVLSASQVQYMQMFNTERKVAEARGVAPDQIDITAAKSLMQQGIAPPNSGIAAPTTAAPSGYTAGSIAQRASAPRTVVPVTAPQVVPVTVPQVVAPLAPAAYNVAVQPGVYSANNPTLTAGGVLPPQPTTQPLSFDQQLAQVSGAWASMAGTGQQNPANEAIYRAQLGKIYQNRQAAEAQQSAIAQAQAQAAMQARQAENMARLQQPL